jgi:NAD(P)-dependent dehydrogenase (short-subunit alcohol dehydrogenase family)
MFPNKPFDKIIDVNVHGVLHTAQAAGRQMTRLGTPGSIIMIASMSGSITNQVRLFQALWRRKCSFLQGQHWAAYNTSKAAVLQLARSMAAELAPHKIRVNSISPGYILTKYVPVHPPTENSPSLK